MYSKLSQQKLCKNHLFTCNIAGCCYMCVCGLVPIKNISSVKNGCSEFVNDLIHIT